MAGLDWSHCPAVESTPGKVGENLEGLSVEEVMEQFDVTREQIAAVLEFVAQSLRGSALAQVSGPVDAHSF